MRGARWAVVAVVLTGGISAGWFFLHHDSECSDAGNYSNACDAQPQSDLRNALVAAKTCFTDSDGYWPCGAKALASLEPSVRFVSGETSSDAAGKVSVIASECCVGLAAWAKTGTCWYILDDAAHGTTFGLAETESGGCLGSDAQAVATGASW